MGEIHKNGVHQGDLVQFLKTVNTNAETDKTTLDAALAGLDELATTTVTSAPGTTTTDGVRV